MGRRNFLSSEKWRTFMLNENPWQGVLMLLFDTSLLPLLLSFVVAASSAFRLAFQILTTSELLWRMYCLDWSIFCLRFCFAWGLVAPCLGSDLYHILARLGCWNSRLRSQSRCQGIDESLMYRDSFDSLRLFFCVSQWLLTFFRICFCNFVFVLCGILRGMVETMYLCALMNWSSSCGFVCVYIMQQYGNRSEYNEYKNRTNKFCLWFPSCPCCTLESSETYQELWIVDIRFFSRFF